MTAIAYRDGVMVADTEMSIGNVKSRCVKIAKKNGHLIGMCGSDCPPLAMFVTAFGKKDEEAKKLLKEFKFAALVVTPKGEMQLWTQSMTFEPLQTPFYAIGSGSEVAIGAMEMGASSRRAVLAAIKWAPGVSGPMTTLRLSKEPTQ
jgi:hypothetical protein